MLGQPLYVSALERKIEPEPMRNSCPLCSAGQFRQLSTHELWLAQVVADKETLCFIGPQFALQIAPRFTRQKRYIALVHSAGASCRRPGRGHEDWRAEIRRPGNCYLLRRANSHPR